MGGWEELSEQMEKALMKEDHLQWSVPTEYHGHCLQLEEKFLLNKRHLDSGTDPLRVMNKNLRFKVLMSHG